MIQFLETIRLADGVLQQLDAALISSTLDPDLLNQKALCELALAGRS